MWNFQIIRVKQHTCVLFYSDNLKIPHIIMYYAVLVLGVTVTVRLTALAKVLA
jgi:hypothetical protein